MDEFLLGSIVLLPYTFTPRGFMPCHGQMLPVTSHRALFSLLGTGFGGNGQDNFALPDLRAAEPHPACHYFICIEGSFPAMS